MTRGGQKMRPEEPERRCIATGETQPRAGLIRFVVAPDGSVVPDLLGKLPGRGIWVSADRAALDLAVKKGLFSRGAKRKVTVPDGMADRLEAALADRVVHLISLARKAGDAVAGYEKVKDWLVKGEAQVLIQSSDGSERGKSKLRPPEETGLFVGVLTAQELGLAFGRENVIHGALAAGGLTTRVVEEAAKLEGLRGKDGGKAPRKGTKTR
ncbi:RNA-binding protein [Aliiroseovarius subalbicans]|uniref:RNA-binding protein n=1 Tax=Aliiroseovarius subalbicans TaxID=2925840 RepID=UPI001F59C664|nr:RNA-binding protein [Aliiroseovarius subalbicans]MCI2400094.1 RNA-binding protein [Aliiroseovarius subalbicans]